MTLQMNFHLRPYNQYILNIVTNIYLGLDFMQKSDIFYRFYNLKSLFLDNNDAAASSQITVKLG